MSLIIGNSGGKFDPHPEGQFAARCVDVVDVGWVVGKWGPKYRVRPVFFCGEYTERETDTGTVRVPLLVSESFTATTNPKGHLRAFLESWRGKVLTQEEAQQFNMERMLNAVAYIQVVHNRSGEDTYANIKSIMRLPEDRQAPPVPEGFKRVCEREGWAGPAPHPRASKDVHKAVSGGMAPTADDDDDLPF